MSTVLALRTLVLCAVMLLAFPLPAAAHNVLIGSDPADGATLSAAPTTLTLTFDQPVVNLEPAVALIGPDGRRYEQGPPEVAGSTVSTSLAPLGPAGQYTVGFRVVSADGHPVTGEVRFTLSPEAAGTGTGAPAPDAPGAGAASANAGGLSGWLWAAVAVAALMVAAAAVVILRPTQGRRTKDPSG